LGLQVLIEQVHPVCVFRLPRLLRKLFEQAGDEPLSQLLEIGHSGRREWVEPNVSLGILKENSVGHESIEVKVKIQGRTKSLDASCGSAKRLWDSLSPSAALLPRKKRAQKQHERQTNQLGPPREQKAELHRQSQDPLPNRNGGKHRASKVCRRVGHPSPSA
jgi:hypothetical protein